MVKKIIISIIIVLGLIFIGTLFMNKQLQSSVESVSGVLAIQHWNTAKGVPVYFVNAPNLPMCDFQIAFDAGSARDGKQNGIAHLTNTLLNEGTTTLDANEVAEQFEEVGAEFEVGTYRDMATVHVRSLTQPAILQSVMKILIEVMSQPAFLETGFKREQAQMLMGLKYESQRPDVLAQKLFFTTLYADHPYANWGSGQIQTLQKLTPEEIKAFYKKYYVAKNAVITIVGALTLEEAQAMAEKVSDALQIGERAAGLPAVQDLQPAQVANKVTFPSEQTHIMVGVPGMKRGDPDFFALSVGNHILGGNGTVTRIFNEIRHKRGLAYDAYSYFMPMRERGPFTIGLQTKTEQTPEALKILSSTVKQFVSEGPTEQELKDAKLNILGGYPLLFDNNKSILSNITMLGFYNLPLDYFDTYKKNIEAVSVGSIQDAFKRRIDPDNMVIVTVGR